MFAEFIHHTFVQNIIAISRAYIRGSRIGTNP